MVERSDLLCYGSVKRGIERKGLDRTEKEMRWRLQKMRSILRRKGADELDVDVGVRAY